MCGIALIVGPDGSDARFRQMLDAIRPRGESEEVLIEPDLRLGTQRLKIVDRERARQPWVSADGAFALCYNGEVFNYRELRDALAGNGARLRSESDTEVVLEAFLHWGTAGVSRLRGEFAFAVVERTTGRVYLGRDPLGVKPLYWVRAGQTLSVASELKALVPLGLPVHEVPPGHHGWAEPGSDPKLAPYVDLFHLGEGLAPLDDPDEAVTALDAAFDASVAARVDTDLTVGVVLSGGLDSSYVLATALRHHSDCVAFTIGTADSEDVATARRLAADLGVPHEVLTVEPRQLRWRDVREAIASSELTEYGDVINATISNRLYEGVHRAGVKVVLCGDGADELFGGYAMYRDTDAPARQRLFAHKLGNLGRTELQRVDRASMGHGVEARVPFLDIDLVELAMRVPPHLKVRDGVEKWILRQAAAGHLPDYVLRRRKLPLSHASGLHERVRLFRPLFPRTYQSLGYGLLGPARRDFSNVLESNGYDLDAAVRSAVETPGYSPTEQALDFLGALRWNLRRSLRTSGTGSPPVA